MSERPPDGAAAGGDAEVSGGGAAPAGATRDDGDRPAAARQAPGDAGPAPGAERRAARPGRAAVRDLFLRLLGLVVVLAFVSLLVQLPVLVGSAGLLPAAEFLDGVRELRPDALERWLALPTVFWWGSSDGALAAAAWLGIAAGAGLMAGLAPHLCLLAAWALYLSFVTVGRTFLSFQWDNLLLEALLCSLFVAPLRWRLSARAPPPPRLGVALVLWLAVRLHVESAASKLLSGDPTWRDLSAMVSYYETAPLPTALGWWAHQMPVWAHRLSALATFVVELGVGALVLLPRRARGWGLLVVAGMHASIQATANYGFFNLLSVVVCLLVLDDGHLPRWLRRGRELARPQAPPRRWRVVRGLRTAALALVVAALMALGALPFLPWLADLPGAGGPARALALAAEPVSRALAPFRSVNAYHLFARMTNLRDEIVLEGSDDEQTWETYELHSKPGDPTRAPPFVAPHQPRVDFQLWFLLLPADTGGVTAGEYFSRRLGPRQAAWFWRLVERLLEEPAAVAGLFANNPFPDSPPQALRLSAWRYHFTDGETRAATGAWWTRELLHRSGPIRRSRAADPADGR